MAGFWDIVIPKAYTNLVTNPSFETGTTGFTTGGANTIAQSSEQASRGAYSLKITYDDADAFALYAITLPSAGVYHFGVDLYIPTSYSGSALNVGFNGFTSATGVETAADLSIRDEWQRVYLAATIDAGDLSGNLALYLTNSINSVDVGDNFYTDGWLCVKSPYEVTYFDGDSDGCRWISTPHGSKSASDGIEASIGYYLSLREDFGYRISVTPGTGLPKVTNLSSPLALQPGTLHDGQYIDNRLLTLQGTLIGDTVTDWHAKRRALIRALNSNTGRIDERSRPRVFRVTSPAIHKTIKAVYDSGLEDGLPLGFTEKDINLKLLADDPIFESLIEDSAVLTPFTTTTFRYVAGRVDGQWSALGPPSSSGTYTAVHDVQVYHGKVYFCGDFLNFDNIANADYIVQYDLDTQTYSALGTGLNGIAYQMAIDADGTLYVVGAFTTAGGTTVRGVAAWDGSAWAALGPPSSGGTVYAIALKPNSSEIYVGGSFTNWDGDADADGIAVWNGSVWAALGTGNDLTTVFALAFNDAGALYVGGSFTAINGDSTKARIAGWVDGAYYSLNEGIDNGQVNTIAVDRREGIVYVGGTFNGSAEGNYLTVWNLQQWLPFTEEVNDDVRDLYINNQGELFVVGDFTTAGGNANFQQNAIWNGSVWIRPDFGANGLPYSVTYSDTGDIFLGLSTSAALQHGATDTIAYVGTFQAYPIITIKRVGGVTAQLLSMVNYTTSAGLYFDYFLKDGEQITIDLRPGNQTMTSNFSIDPINALRANSDFGAFYLTPTNDGTGTNKIITMMGVNAATVTVNMRWRDAFISED